MIEAVKADGARDEIALSIARESRSMGHQVEATDQQEARAEVRVLA